MLPRSSALAAGNANMRLGISKIPIANDPVNRTPKLTNIGFHMPKTMSQIPPTIPPRRLNRMIGTESAAISVESARMIFLQNVQEQTGEALSASPCSLFVSSIGGDLRFTVKLYDDDGNLTYMAGLPALNPAQVSEILNEGKIMKISSHGVQYSLPQELF